MQLEEIIPKTNLEDSNVEFKRLLDEGKSPDSGKAIEINWLKTLAAFANTNGGVMYVGIDDKTHKIISLDHETADKTILRVNRQVKQRLEPTISYKIEPISITAKTQTRYILKITVEPNKILPVTLHEENLLGIYIRSYSSSILATPEQIRDLILMSDNNPFDQSFTQETFNIANFSKLFTIYKERTNQELTEKALISFGFMNSDKRLSRGAQLFKDDYNDNRTKIVCTLWPEISKGSSIVFASETFTGNLFDSISFATQFIESHSVKGFKKEAMERVDFFSYPSRSITEGIVNAIAHRNYYIIGSQIEVNLFKDRLEISSPGALLGVNLLKKEKNIASIMPRRRNEVICNILEHTRYMESKGSGFDKIEQDYVGKGETFRPFISSDSNSFTLTLPNLTFKAGVLDEDSIPNVHIDGLLTGKNDNLILSYCFKKAHSAAEIAEYIKVKPSTYFRKEVLGRLVSEGYLLADFSTRIGLYLSNPDKVFVD